MAITGGWRAAYVAQPYAGATRWGTGINPVHGLRDPEHHPETTKLPLGATGPGDQSPEVILGPVAWGYQAEDAQFYAGEDYRYLADDHPNLGEASTGRPDRDGQIMEVGAYPQPEGWPSWGPANVDGTSDDFPLTGPPGGAQVRAFSDELEIERGRAIAIPTAGVTGGWLNKAHGLVLVARDSDPAQLLVTTSGRQLHSHLDNGRAVARGTDEPREPIVNRLTGMKAKVFARSLGMGGGPGTPDMFPQQQDGIPKRPFFYRSGAMPPAEEHTWNTITYFEPVARTVPDDPGALVATSETTGQTGGGYGYTAEDGGWF